MKIAGIDYGAKSAGTTAITFESDGKLFTKQCKKNDDADIWLVQTLHTLDIGHIYLDAPLSLPIAYTDGGENFFYREADILLKAMSPMFLGGLTARAMSLKKLLCKSNIQCTEVYPSGLVRMEKQIFADYDKKNAATIADVLRQLQQLIPYHIHIMPINYHQLDSVICWYIGWKHQQNIAQAFGNESEGMIWI